MKKFEVSVIIPVYNAEEFVLKALESAVFLPEVGEIILVEDGSPDNALKICYYLESTYPKVKLYRHPKGANLGAGASRNLGMEKATCEYVAFLDADDWYLPNRFKNAKELFKDPEVDGVYEPIGSFFYEPEAILLGEKRKKEDGDKVITFPKATISSNNLFRYLLYPIHGTFSTDGVTLRKSLVEKVGNFSTELKLHQDLEYWVRCAYHGNLVAPSNPEIVAIRGVHKDNRIAKRTYDSRALYFKVLVERLRGEKMSFKEKAILFKRSVIFNNQRKYKSVPVITYLELYLVALKSFFVFLLWRKPKRKIS